MTARDLVRKLRDSKLTYAQIAILAKFYSMTRYFRTQNRELSSEINHVSFVEIPKIW